MPRVRLSNGEELILRPDPAMLPGREGAVYPDPSDPGFVIKLPHTPDDDWRGKLRLMLAEPLVAPDLAWPAEPVHSSDCSTIVGYRMPYAARKHPIAAVYSTEPTTRWVQADYGFRLEVAINLVAAFRRIHQHGCVAGDLSQRNTLVGKDASVCLIDIDSFQITRNGRTFRCKVGTQEYTPPELHGLSFDAIDRTVYHDAFGLAVFIFELLVGPGNHPFAARHEGAGSPLPLLDRIRLGIWPYAKKGHPDYAPRTAAPLDLLHPLLQPLMFDCFEAGHADPKARPLTDKWLIALNEVKQDTDFVRVTAPQIEAEAQLRQRQARLAAFAAGPPSPAKRRKLATARRSRPRLWNRKVLLPIAASFLLVATGGGLYLAMPRGPSIDFVQKGQQPLPTPALYGSLSAQEQIAPSRSATNTGSLPTPALYDHIADNYR